MIALARKRNRRFIGSGANRVVDILITRKEPVFQEQLEKLIEALL